MTNFTKLYILLNLITHFFSQYMYYILQYYSKSINFEINN